MGQNIDKKSISGRIGGFTVRSKANFVLNSVFT